MRKTIFDDKYCIGCRKFLNSRCDILGEVAAEKQNVCRQAGYKVQRAGSYLGYGPYQDEPNEISLYKNTSWEGD